MHSVSKNFQRGGKPGERNPKQRPLQGAFLIPPALPVAADFKNKSTASGGETPKGSAVPGVYRLHRDLWHTRRTLFSRNPWA